MVWKGVRYFSPNGNPFEGIRVRGAKGGRRDRSLEPGELEGLLKACKGCRGLNKYYVPLAIHLTIETGLRRGELINLRWGDVDILRRRICVRHSKTDYATGDKDMLIVLPPRAELDMYRLHFCLNHLRKLPSNKPGGMVIPPHIVWRDMFGFETIISLNTEPNSPVFPMTGDALEQAFDHATERAEINLPGMTPKQRLIFKDLRREANTRFILAGLTREERNIQMRHGDDDDINSTYIGRNQLLRSIQDKLDRLMFGGKTRDEMDASMTPEDHRQAWKRIEEIGREFGEINGRIAR